MKKVLQIGLLVSLLGAGLAQAQQASASARIYREGGSWVQEGSGTVSEARSLRLKTDMGNVHIQGGGQAITYTFKVRVNTGNEDAARRRMEAFRVTTGHSGAWAVIAGDCVRDCPQNVSVEFVVNVPRDLEAVKLETGGGNVGVSGLNGKLEAETGGGGLSLNDIGGPVAASTGGGNVDVGSTRSALAVSTGGGNIHVAYANGVLTAETGGGGITIDTGNAAVSVETGGGGIHIGKAGGALKVTTGGGNIEVGDVGGAVIAETGGGGIRVNSAQGMVRAETGGGNLTLYGLAGGVRTETGAGTITAELVSGGSLSDSVIESGSGDIVVYISPNLHVTVRAAVEFCTGKGIVTDFTDLHVRSEGGDYGPREVYAEGSLNGGGPVLKIRTSNGNIEIHRGKK